MTKCSKLLRIRDYSDWLEGHYARKQIFSPSRVISWTHRRRIETALQLAAPFAGKRVLDLGCGDGTFLAYLMRQERAPSHAVGAETSDDLVEDCRGRLEDLTDLEFVLTDQLIEPRHSKSYDAVFCMEVLEHVVDVAPVLEQMNNLVSPTGYIVISVPVETGPPLLVKQSLRTVAGWMGVGDYPGTSSCTVRELAAGLFAGRHQHMKRPVLQDGVGRESHDHKGFNWRHLEDRLQRQFEIVRKLTSPIRWLPPMLGSQVWFLIRPIA
jgi:SAM-dependent methyltransferase